MFLHAAETNQQSTKHRAALPLLSLRLSVLQTRIKRSASSSHYRLSSRVPHANHRTGSWQRFVDMSAMCLCSRNQGQTANLSVSHSGEKKHSVCNMGEIQSNLSGFAATTLLCSVGNRFIRGKSALISSVLTSILDVLHCVREIMNNQ